MYLQCTWIPCTRKVSSFNLQMDASPYMYICLKIEKWWNAKNRGKEREKKNIRRTRRGGRWRSRILERCREIAVMMKVFFHFYFYPPSFLFDSKILSLLPETLNSFLLNHAFPITRSENIENINPLVMKIFLSSHYFTSQAKSLPRLACCSRPWKLASVNRAPRTSPLLHPFNRAFNKVRSRV